MKLKRNYECVSCKKNPLSKDEIGVSKKILGRDTKELFCIDCLSAYLEVTPEDILDKIQEFKEDGCELFN